VANNEVLYLANNIIEGNDASFGGGVYYGRSNGFAPPLITHNDIVGNQPENWTTGTYYPVPDPTGTSGNISIDPLLSPTGDGRYTLLAGSPALDAGTLAVPGVAGPDVLGGARVQASAIGGLALIDMGAAESPYPGANTPPVAIAFARGGFRQNGTVVLDGTRSFDPDGDALTFLWSQVAGPPVTLSSGNAPFVTLLNPGTSRAPATGVFTNLVSLPTSVFLELTVSDGKASSSSRLEVRMLDVAAPIDIDVAGYFFDQESGIPGYKGGITFSPDGSDYFVVTQAEFFRSAVFRGPVVRDPVTSRILALGSAQQFATLRQGTGLAMHPGGTLFAAADYFGPTLVLALLEIRPDGSTASFDISSFGITSLMGFAFVPPGPANAGRLLVADDATQQIHEIQLADNGDGTFTPTGSSLFLDLAAIVGLRLTAMTFLGPDGGPYDLLVFAANSLGPSNTVYRVDLDPVTGQAVGGPLMPAVTNAFDQISSYSLFWPYVISARYASRRSTSRQWRWRSSTASRTTLGS